MRREFKKYFSELTAELERLPSRPARGELLERAYAIPLQFSPEEFPPDRPLHEQFQRSLMPWGGKVHFAADRAEAKTTIFKLARESGAKVASRWRVPLLDSLDPEKTLAELGLEWIETDAAAADGWTDQTARNMHKDRLARIALGITTCDYAVAQTGSVVIRHDSLRDGFTNLLPWTLITVVTMDQMLGTVQEAFERLGAEREEKPWGSNVQFITGPSRSGDIDLTVGQGAAGPGQYHVVLILD